MPYRLIYVGLKKHPILKRFATLSVICLFATFCNAQSLPDSIPVDVASVREDSSIFAKTLLFIDSSGSISATDVLHKHFFPLQTFKTRKRIPPEMVPYSYFLKIYLSNNSVKETSIFLYTGSYFSETKLFKLNSLPEPLESKESIPGYKKITLSPGEKCQMLVYMKPLKNESNAIIPILVNTDYVETYRLFIVGHKDYMQVFGLVLSGILLMMILFMITNFIINRRLEFLYNALYSLCMFLLIYFNAVTGRNISDFVSFYYGYFDFFLLVIGSIFYIAFTRRFLSTKANHKLLDRILKYGESLILLMLAIYTYLHFFTPTYMPQYLLENGMKFFILGIGVVFIYLAFKQKNRLFNYIAAGNAMLILFSFVSLGLLVFKIKAAGIFTYSVFYYNIGIVSELTLFLLGLTYKNRNELILRTQEQEAMKLAAEKKEFETKLAVIQAQQEERNRISADMHDDLGAGMTTIRLYSELAKNKLPENSIPEIDKISSSANELLNKMNAIIWSMSSSNDSLGNMIAYIRSYAIEYFENTGINCHISIPADLPNIEVIGEIRRNVFLVVKEALNNILKHSKATDVEITLTRIDNDLILYIQDNGIGIDLDKLRLFGNGLKNMKKRMADVNIEFSIENKNGTLVTLRRRVVQF